MMLAVQSAFSLSPDGRHFVSATTLGGSVETFEIGDDCISPVSAKAYYPLEFEAVDGMKRMAPNSAIGFTSVYAANDCWIGSYSGTPSESDCTKIGVWD